MSEKHNNLRLRAVWMIFAIVAATCVLLPRAHAADDLTQQLQPSPDGHFLAQPDGEPFFWLGENGWELFQRPDHDEVEAYFKDRAGKGFNIILAVLGGVNGAKNRYGEELLVNRDPTHPNPKYFENVDWIVERAAHYGLRLAIVAIWAAGNQTAGHEPGEGPKIFNPANAEIYGRWIAERYRNKGIVWILGGDSNPLWPDAGLGTRSAIADFRPIYDAMAIGINEGNGGPAFITYHPSCCSYPGTAQPRTSLYLGDRSWLTMNMLQSSHYEHPAPAVQTEVGFDFSWLGPYNYEPIRDEYDAVPARPVVDGEARFEGLTIDNDPPARPEKGMWTAYDARNAAYHAVFAGAAGHTYGCHTVWQFFDPEHNRLEELGSSALPWRKAIASPTAGQLQYLKRLLLSRPYFSHIPDESLVVSDTNKGAAHIGAVRARDGSYAMVYAPQGRSFSVDLKKITGDYAVGWWFNPDTGEATRIYGTFATTSAHEFTPPSSGKEIDWVLVLDDESKKYGAPGQELKKK